jgi:signal transduction histidine kinase
MAKTKRKAGKRTTAAGRSEPRARKSGVPKTGRPGSRKPKPTKPAPRKRKPSLPSETARLKRRLKAARMQQQASAEILRAVLNASGDAALPLQQIAEITARLFGAPSVSIQLTEGGEFTQEYRVGAIAQRIGSAYPRSNIRVGGPNMPGTVVFENRQIHIPDLDHLDPSMSDWPGLPHARAGGSRTLCGTPLRREGNAIGALMIFRDRLLPFTDDELALQQSFADQAAIAIENARLLNETRNALERQTATSEVLGVISKAPGELEIVFESILSNAVRLCGARFGNLFLREGDGFRAAAMHGAPRAYVEAWHLDPVMFGLSARPHIPLARLAATRQIVHIADIAAVRDPNDRDPRYLTLLGAAAARTMLLVPMLKEEEILGAIVIYSQEVRPYSEKQIELLQNFAAQAVIAIENTRLLNALKDRTEELSRSLDDLSSAQDRLIQTEKLASLGQLTAGIAHEIKNPLNFVNNFAALSAELTDELYETLAPAPLDQKMRGEIGELTQLLRSNLEKVVQHGKRADSIVKNMLLHSREGSGEHRPADINAIVDESLNLAYHGARAEKAGFSIALQRNLDPSAGMADVYPQEITRVLLNLISNGFYAATKRRAEADDGFEALLSATTKNLGDKIEIRIRDNGTGIPAEIKEKIFNPFFTTKASGEGTGLGLSMSHDIIVKQHGGSIDVETESGRFTEFKIVLPRTSQR